MCIIGNAVSSVNAGVNCNSSNMSDKFTQAAKTFDELLLANMPPSKRADVVWKRNRFSQLLGRGEIYPTPEVCRAQFVPYLQA